MKRKSDRELGMGRDISRRTFIADMGLASAGLTMAPAVLADGNPGSSGQYYPPTRTGIRGSHPGSFEGAHHLASRTRSFGGANETGEQYDLVVVGGGISGLATALYYQDRFGPGSRILVLDNHDDFGGHAKRNEFHQGGEMRLALGGTHNLEYTEFSDLVNQMMDRLGIDIRALKKHTQFSYGARGPGKPAVLFDREHFGEHRLMMEFDLQDLYDHESQKAIDQMPLEESARTALKKFFQRREDLSEGKTEAETEAWLRSYPYFDFLHDQGGLPWEVIALYNQSSHGREGFGTINLSTWEALASDFPGWHLLGWSPEEMGGEAEDEEGDGYRMVMFPDGNASVARLMVSQLIPGVSPGADFSNIAVSRFDYSKLDTKNNLVRLRLNSTATGVRNTTDGVQVDYLREEQVYRVAAKHCVLACYHSLIPYICPELPREQKDAQAYAVKSPQLLTNVLLRDAEALNTADLSRVYCPSRLHSYIFRWQGNTAGGFEQGRLENQSGPVNLVFWGSVAEPPGTRNLKERLRGSRARMLSLSFDEYEREVRTVLDELLGPHGLDVSRDILAISVNRWPHGYAYYYMDLWDPDFGDGKYPHEIARKPFGNISIANSDAAADAYTHRAIEQADRAVKDLPG